MKSVRRNLCVSAVLIGLLQSMPAAGPVDPATVGAKVDESLATLQIHVNPAAPGASDSNTGTSASPVATIQRGLQLAVAANSQGVGVRVRIAAGTYRETVRLEGSGSATPLPIVVEAITKGSVIITGSDLWTGWSAASPAGSYSHAWPHAWGMVPYPAGWECCVVLSEMSRRREMVFVNGARMRQVLSPGALAPGTFYISEADHQVRVMPAAGVDIAAATVEVAVRSALFTIQNRSNVVVRGLQLKHDTNGVGGTAALNVFNATNVLIEDATLAWNNFRGLSIADTTGLTVRRTTANDNGSSGIGGWKMRSTLIEDTEASRNNWRGVEGDFTDWDPAGIKLMLLHNAALVRVTLTGNHAYGLWLDTDCADVLVRGLSSSESLYDGVFLEAIQGPVTIDDATLSRNGRSGLLIGNASAGTLTGSTLDGNKQAQVLISGTPAGRPAENFETGEKYPGIQSVKWTFTANNFHSVSAAQRVTTTTLPAAVWQAFVDTLTSDWNSWYNPASAQSFLWTGGLPLDFADWKLRTHQDQHSVFAATRVPRPPVNIKLQK